MTDAEKKYTDKDLNKAIGFGLYTLGSINLEITLPASNLKSHTFLRSNQPLAEKRRTASKSLESARGLVDEIRTRIRIDYSGIPIAEDGLAYAEKELKELEKAAKPFLEPAD